MIKIVKASLCFLLLLHSSIIDCKSKEEWKSRAIYQIITDRFARSNGDQQGCQDLHKYCGGTFKGITNNLDYIAELGFNAIWISPILENTPDSYHGYHFTNLYNLNSNFGNEEDLNTLISEAHKRDIWVMVDVVANHSGPIGTDYSRVFPFNKAEHYHDYCIITNDDFAHNQYRVENCRLADLPDLKQENDYVRTTLLDWIKNIIAKYNIDGIRIDTIPEVPKWFWSQFSNAAGVYQVGEVFNGNIDYVSDYQNYLDAVLNYPLYFTIKDSFAYGKSLYNMESILKSIDAKFKDSSALGVFVNNHDNQRFLYFSNNKNKFQNAIVFSLLTKGIPILYYGDEQMFNGGDDPFNRETMWGRFDRQSEMYQLIKRTNNVRKSNNLSSKPQIQRYADDIFYAFTRDNVLAVFTNSDNWFSRDITYHSFKEGTQLCNQVSNSEEFLYSDCVYVSGGKITINMRGAPKVYVAVNTEDELA